MNAPIPSVNDLVEAALSGDSGLDPRSSQEPEKVASGKPTDICDEMEKTAAELEDWAMSQMEGNEALEEKLEQDWGTYQQDRMYKIALARTMTETVALVSGTEGIREANWGETIKKASVAAEQDKTSTSKRSLFLAAQARSAKPASKAAQAAERVVEKVVKKVPAARSKRSGGKASSLRTAAAIGIPAATAGGYALGSRSNGS